MSVKLRIGALCRLDDGAPARYVGHGVGLSITLTGCPTVREILGKLGVILRNLPDRLYPGRFRFGF